MFANRDFIKKIKIEKKIIHVSGAGKVIIALKKKKKITESNFEEDRQLSAHSRRAQWLHMANSLIGVILSLQTRQGRVLLSPV